ncbi:cell surface glycoprotein CD200 receptor 1 isoform X2 [Pogona vitticeps]
MTHQLAFSTDRLPLQYLSRLVGHLWRKRPFTITLHNIISIFLPEQQRKASLHLSQQKYVFYFWNIQGSDIAILENKPTWPENHLPSSSTRLDGIPSSVVPVQLTKSAVVSTPAVLDCPQHSYVLAVWRIYLKNGTSCYISYKRETNSTERNCSKNMNWVSRPDQISALRLKSPEFSSEGIYMCSIAYARGTFIYKYNLTVLAPPEVSLTHTINGTAVCKAAAGKPAAQISWAQRGDYDTMKETLHNGTETVTSIYNTTNTNEDEVVCIISHPAWKDARILNISLGRYNERRKDATMKILYSSLAGLLGILVLSLFIYAWRFFYGRQTDPTIMKSPETISARQSIQDNELEPYATFVQVENMIYDKTGDFVQA